MEEGAVRVRIEQGCAGLVALESDWRALCERAPGRCYVTTYEWYEALLRHRLRKPDAVRFIATYIGNRCTAIIPIQPNEIAEWALRGLDSYSIPKDTHTPLCDFPVSDDFDPEASWDAIRAELRRQNLKVSAIRFPRNPHSSGVELALAHGGARTVARRTGASCYFDSSESIETIRARYSSRLKKSLKRGRGKLAAAGEVTIRTATSGADLEWAFNEFLRIEGSGWKGTRGTASALGLDDSATAFYRYFFDTESPRLGAHVRLLMLEGRPIAAQLGLQRDSVRYIIKIAYDEQLADLSPGQVLMDRAIEEACGAAEVTRLSLVTGVSWMRDWRPYNRPVMTHWLALTPLSQVLLGIWYCSYKLLSARNRRVRRTDAEGTPPPARG